MSPHFTIAIAALFGGLSVVLGAFAAHGLKGSLEPRLFDAFETGVTYQMTHSLALILLGLAVHAFGRSLAWDIATWSFIVGIVFFSGSLYGLALTEAKILGPITPLGGLFFIVGWASFAYGAFQSAAR